MDSQSEVGNQKIVNREMLGSLEFWFEFTNSFVVDPSAEVKSALNHIGWYGHLLDIWRQERHSNQYPNGFIEKVQKYQEDIQFLFREQVNIINNHFGSDTKKVQRAFEDFGQGILFDDRMRVGVKVHMMDIIELSGTEGATRGYHRWHTFIRASAFLGEESESCLRLDRIISLGWAIQSHLKPKQDTHTNPKISEDKLHEFQKFWLNLNFEELDTAFERYPYPESPVVLTTL